MKKLIFNTNFGNYCLSLTKDHYLISLLPSQEGITKKFHSSRDELIIHEINEYFAGKIKYNFSICKMVPEGTDFQKQVWSELYNIPYGQTATYGEIAKKIDNPKAVRAVATAIKNNPIAVLLPCHRVLPASGKLGNYRWGAEMKKKLLEAEGFKI